MSSKWAKMGNTIDLDYRPNSYFWPDQIGIQLSSQIKGSQRKYLYEASVAKGDRDIDELLANPSLSSSERALIGKFHPSFMGVSICRTKLMERLK